MPDIDSSVIDAAGYATRGAGAWDSRKKGKNPAVLCIDMQDLAFGPDVDILTAIREHHTAAMGEIAWRALPIITSVVETARELRMPVIHTQVIPRGLTVNDPLTQIVPELQPLEGEIVFQKSLASAFAGTSILRHLIQLQVDQVIIVGNSTSGCVRATAIDAQQHGFAVCVPEDAVFDRIQLSHQATLLDLWMKYALVAPAADVIADLKNVATL
jgi:nicotinamidase-related amidase